MSGVRVPAPPPPILRAALRLRRIEPVLRRALRGPCALDDGRRILVAVSGGADSTALLLALHRLSSELGLELVAAHLHHGLRGADADADLDFVRERCARLGVPLEAARWDTGERMRRRGLSGQNGLRQLRQEFLLDAARRVGAHAVATAHTADDQLETLLLRLARGTGLEGLGGMSPRRGPWIRPLLEASRADIEADLRAASEDWREDRSNADLAYARNRVRHQVVPGLVKVASGAAGLGRGALAKRVAATLREVRGARRILARRAAAALAEAGVRGPGKAWVLDCDRLRSHAEPIVRLALRQAWGSVGLSGGLTRPALDSLSKLARGARAGRWSLPQGWVARRLGSTLRIEPEAIGIERGTASDAACRSLRIPGLNKLGDIGLRASWVAGLRARRALAGGIGGEFFAASHLEGGLELRPGRTDEWFIPFGRRQPRRLGDFLKRAGVRRASRSGRMVLADRQGILWVVGVRRSARAPLTSGTRKALWVRTQT